MLHIAVITHNNSVQLQKVLHFVINCNYLSNKHLSTILVVPSL